MNTQATPIQVKLNKLRKRLEKKWNIRIICMVECGSRAYGLHSSTSDYDIRFIYIQADKNVYYDDYLDPEARQNRLHKGFTVCDDVEQRTITSKSTYPDKTEIDYHGWDITKANKHLYEMNGSIVEWVYSPIVYFDDGTFLKRAKQLLCAQKRTYPIQNHYKGMAMSHFKEYLEDEKVVKIKKYLVCVRSCIMYRWIELNKTECWQPLIQIDFPKVLEHLDPYLDDDLLRTVRGLVKLKKNNGKDEFCLKNSILNKFINDVLFKSFHDEDGSDPKPKGFNRLLDQYFLDNFQNLRF